MPMKMQIAPVCEADLEEVSRFLRKAFGADENWVPFQAEVVRWKALTPHPLWQGARGYALRSEGAIVAYGCAVPTRLRQGSGETLVACVVDWAANKAVPGSGVAVYHHIAKLTDGLIGLGGSDHAQRVVQGMGFQVRQEFEVSARVTQPVRQFLKKPTKDWRDVARLGRNLWRGIDPRGAKAEGWEARRVERFDESVDPVLPLPGFVSSTVCYRDSGILNYLLGCPAARMQGYVVEHSGSIAGYFLLAFKQGECRIAELWVDSGKEQDWLATLMLAFEGREGSQVSVGSSTGFTRRIAALAGFHAIARQSLYVKDPKGMLPQEMDAAISLSDTDAFFL
jgi:hypothetical protein